MKKGVFKSQTTLFSVLGIIGIVCASLFVTSCNKEFPDTLRSEYPNDTTLVNYKARKVLYILLDGVRGDIVGNLALPNISQISRKSIYAYNGLTDSKSIPMTNGGAWANSLIGVTSDKHMVTDDSFSGNQINAFPSLFTRFKQTNAKLRTASIAATKAFNDNLAVDATVKVDAQNDDVQVRDAVIAELGRSDAGIVVAQFNSADVAGTANGYGDNSTAYVAAITQLDTYIGNIMTALQNRSTFNQEDWMVVIASNKGGNLSSSSTNGVLGAFGDTNRNSFILFYNPRFISRFVPAPDVNSLPYVGYAPKFLGGPSTAGIATLSNTTVGNFGTSGEFTLMFKLRYDGKDGTNFPTFLGKRAGGSSFGSGTGWSFLFGTTNVQLQWTGASTISNPSGTTLNVKDGIWHTIAFKVYDNAGTRTLLLFADGVRLSSTSIQGKNSDNAGGLRIGGDINTKINMLIKDLAIYNVAMTDAEVMANMRRQITPTSPYFSNLIGWWPGNETSGTTIADMSGNGNNFTANTAVSRSQFSDSSPNVSPEFTNESYRVVINNVDIPFQIYQWMGIIIPDSWQLDGKLWRPQYIDVRNN